MMRSYSSFLNTIESANSRKVAKSMECVFDGYDLANCTPENLNQLITELNPRSPKGISTVKYIMGLYAQYLKNDALKELVQGVDRKELWAAIKQDTSKKFVSYAEFNRVYEEIGKYEELNVLYLQMLWRSLYEGI